MFKRKPYIGKLISALFKEQPKKKFYRSDDSSIDFSKVPSANVSDDPFSNLFNSGNSHGHENRIFVSRKDKVLHEITLKLNPDFIVGRHPLANMQLKGRNVADFHARFFRHNDKIFIEALTGDKGVLVDGNYLQRGIAVELPPRAQIKIHDYDIRCDFAVAIATRSIATLDKPLGQLECDVVLSQLIGDYLQIKNWTSPMVEVVVSEIISETHDCKTVRMVATRPMLFHFQPGQFVTLFLTINGQDVRRSYSIASSPSRPHVVEITVKRVNNGLVSSWINSQLQVGDRLQIKGPMGKFSCFAYPSPKLLLVAAGSGIVPIMSMLRWLTDTSAAVDIKLLLSFRAPPDIIYHQELEYLARRHPNVALHIAITSDAVGKQDWPGLRGRFNQDAIASLVPDFLERQVFLCGCEPFMEAMVDSFDTLGLPQQQLHKESYSYATPQKKVPAKLSPELLAKRGGKFKIDFLKSGLSAFSDGEEDLLSLAEIYGISIDSVCRTGQCGECMVKCISGDINMAPEAEISERDRQAGWFFSCCSKPRSNLIVDA